MQSCRFPCHRCWLTPLQHWRSVLSKNAYAPYKPTQGEVHEVFRLLIREKVSCKTNATECSVPARELCHDPVGESGAGSRSETFSRRRDPPHRDQECGRGHPDNVCICGDAPRSYREVGAIAADRTL